MLHLALRLMIQERLEVKLDFIIAAHRIDPRVGSIVALPAIPRKRVSG
jgi:hypothetical protein